MSDASDALSRLTQREVNEARASGIRDAIKAIQQVYDLQCPIDHSTRYLKGGRSAHQWWQTVLGGELSRLREAADRLERKDQP